MLASLLVGVAATYFLIVSSNLKGEFLKRELAAAGERTAFLERDTLRVRRALTRESFERLKLIERLSPRTLSENTQGALIDSLRGFQGRTVAVVSYAHDAEAAFLAQAMIDCLEAAGMKTRNGIASVMQFGSPALGIVVSGRDQSVAKIIAVKLSNAGGLDVVLDTSPPDKENPDHPDITVLVGTKPIKTLR